MLEGNERGTKAPGLVLLAFQMRLDLEEVKSM